MEEILSYEKFREHRERSRPESVERYKLYLEVVGYMEYEFLEGFISKER